MGRLWGLGRRQTIVLLGLAAVIGVAIAVVTTNGDGGDGGKGQTAGGEGVTRVSSGTSRDRHGVWAFGFETLHFDTRLRNPEQLDFTGFGSVLGTDGRVYMFDAEAGKVGELSAARNRLTVLGKVPQGSSSTNPFLPAIAQHGRSLWLVTAPGKLARFDLASNSVRSQSTLPTTTAGQTHAGATGLVVVGDALVAVYEADTNLVVARIDPSTGSVVASRMVDTSSVSVAGAPVSIDGVAAGDRAVWVVAGGQVIEVDATTLETSAIVTVSSRNPEGVHGAAFANGAVWVLADNGATLTRIDAKSHTVSVALQVLSTAPATFRLPASLTAMHGRVFAMVQRDGDPSRHAVRVAGIDATTGKPTRAVDLGSALFAGAIAAT